MNFKKYLYSPFFYIFLLIVGYFTFTKIIDGDFGFRLAQGKYFFENNWHLPLKEIYSYTIAGQANIILSWLFDVWLYFIYANLGFFGLSLWKSVVFVLLGVLFIFRLEGLAADKKTLRQGSGQVNLNQWLVYGIAFLFLAAVFGRTNMERPHTLGYIFLSLFLLLIFGFLKENKLWHWFIFIFLQIFWANTHSSFLVSLIILIIFIFGLLGEYYYKQKYIKAVNQEELKQIIQNIKKLFLLFILLALISLINPYGWEIFINFFKASPSGGSRVFIRELWPMQMRDFISLLGIFWALSLFALIKSWRRKDFKMVLTFLAFAFLGITSTRFSYDYVILTAPFSVIALLEISQKFLTALNKTIVGVIAALIFGLIFIFTVNKSEHGFGLSVNNFPIRSADFILQNKVQGRMFNTFNVGSYLIWHLYPQYQVFIDTRAQNYLEIPPGSGQDSKESVFWIYFKVLQEPAVWQKLDEKYNFDFAIVEWPYIRNKKINNTTERNLTPDKWALVFMDSQGIVYLKRNEINKELIEKYEYKYVRPQHIDNYYFDEYLRKPEDWQAAIKEFQRAIGDAPDNYRAHFFYTALLARNPKSDKKEIIEHLKKTVELNPRFGKAKEILKFLESEVAKNKKI